MRDYHVYSWYWKSRKKTHWKDATTHLISKNYEASISQFIHWNDDPFGQDVEHVLMDNILKYGDDPTVNQRDRASTTPELWGSYLTVYWLEWWSVRSRCRACSDGQHANKWWRCNDEPRRSKTIQIRERGRESEERERVSKSPSSCLNLNSYSLIETKSNPKYPLKKLFLLSKNIPCIACPKMTELPIRTSI